MKRNFKYNRKGTTLIELSFVTAIAALLLAMILGLAQHITRISNISKAKSVLGAWHTAMDNWHQTFGEYPGDIYEGGEFKSSPYDTQFSELSHLSNTYYQASITFNISGTPKRVDFRTYCTQPVKILDPWGTPYVYIRDAGKQSYRLFSCGPDADTEEIELQAGRTRTHDTSLDDIYFDR